MKKKKSGFMHEKRFMNSLKWVYRLEINKIQLKFNEGVKEKI